MNNTSPYTTEVGVDVAKDNLRFSINGSQFEVSNKKSSLVSKLKTITKEHPSLRVTCESTGGYENTLIECCLELNIPVSQCNPTLIKNYIRSFGRLAKTDTIDAGFIAQYAQERSPRVLTIKWLDHKKRAELKQRIQFLTDENVRRKTTIKQYKC